MPQLIPMEKRNFLFQGTLRLNPRLIGLASGFVLGLVIFAATNFLLIKGGHINPEGEYEVGSHLWLLGQFFAGYRVSFWGSIIGFFYGFALGAIGGAAIGLVYNKIVDFRIGTNSCAPRPSLKGHGKSWKQKIPPVGR